MIGAQMAIPNQGKRSLKYQAMRVDSLTGAQVPSIPAGTNGFHRLNMSEPAMRRSSCHPPNSNRP